ncbi:MAG: hypothetical protein ACR2F6_02280 [Mycobacteriales bacterium]
MRDLDAVLITHQHVNHVDVDRLGPLIAPNPEDRQGWRHGRLSALPA